MVSRQVCMRAWWRVPAHESTPVIQALHMLMSATRSDPACEGCRLSTEMGETVGFCYVEEWNSEDAMRRQVRSPRFKKFAELLERSTERPRVEFELPSGMRGLDYAEEVLQGESA